MRNRCLVSAVALCMGACVMFLAGVARLYAGEIEAAGGKIAAAKHFIRTVLPHITADKKILESEDGALMGLSESAF